MNAPGYAPRAGTGSKGAG